jgi:hypothetical protein
MHRSLACAVALVVVFASAFAPTCGKKSASSGGRVEGLRRLEFERATGKLTLRAERASLLGILRQLREQYQIEVTVPGLAESKVTAEIDDVPLRDALRQFLPRDSRFFFSVKDLDLSLAGGGGVRKGKEHESPQANLPLKGRVPASTTPGAQVKRRPEEVTLVEGGANHGKRDPGQSRNVPPSNNLKGAFRLQTSGERYARLNLFMDRDGVRRVVRFLIIEGKLIEPKTVDGQLVFAAVVNGETVSVGSVQDPLAHRSYQKDRGHSNERRNEGTFVISLPGKFLSEDVLRQTTVQFFILSEAGTYPQTLTPETFRRFREFLHPAGQIGGDQLLEAFYRSRREGGLR